MTTDEYIAHYTTIALNTDRIDKDKCVENLNLLYIELLDLNVAPVIIMDNPLLCFKEIVKSGYNILNEIWEFPKNILNYKIIEKLSTEIISVVTDTVWTGVIRNVGSDLLKSNMMYIDDYVNPFFSGHLDAHIFAHYAYMLELLGNKLDERLKIMYEIWNQTVNYGTIFTLHDVCYVSEKPTLIKLDKDGRLHSDDGPALKYDGGGVDLYYHHGNKKSEG